MAKKMTRKEALEMMLEVTREGFESEEMQEARAILQKMIESINKQASKPKGKTSARIQNEKYARQLIEKLKETHNTEPFNATWIAEQIPFVMTSQRGYHVAKIAIEWGAIEEITIKKRTFYVFNENYE